MLRPFANDARFGACWLMARIAANHPLPGAQFESLRREHDVVVWAHPHRPSHVDVVGLVKGADAIISLLTDRVDDDGLAGSKALRVVANSAVGCDNVDVARATEIRVPVGKSQMCSRMRPLTLRSRCFWPPHVIFRMPRGQCGRADGPPGSRPRTLAWNSVDRGS